MKAVKGTKRDAEALLSEQMAEINKRTESKEPVIMFYALDPTPEDGKLAHEIDRYLATLPPDARGMRPYVETGGPGVRIRGLTHYSEDIRRRIAKACDAIYERVAESGHPVCLRDTGERWSADDIRAEYRKATRNAGIRVSRFYALRLTHAVYLLEAGVDPRTIIRHLGCPPSWIAVINRTHSLSKGIRRVTPSTPSNRDFEMGGPADKTRPLSGEEISRLLDYLVDTELYLPVLLSMSTGMRCHEILNLSVRDVDLEAGMASVHSRTHERTIELPKIALQALRQNWNEKNNELQEGSNDGNSKRLSMLQVRKTMRIPVQIQDRIVESKPYGTLNTYLHILKTNETNEETEG